MGTGKGIEYSAVVRLLEDHSEYSIGYSIGYPVLKKCLESNYAMFITRSNLPQLAGINTHDHQFVRDNIKTIRKAMDFRANNIYEYKEKIIKFNKESGYDCKILISELKYIEGNYNKYVEIITKYFQALKEFTDLEYSVKGWRGVYSSIEYISMANIFELMKYNLNIDSVLTLFKYVYPSQGKRPSDMFRNYRDYIKMAEEMGETRYEKYPKAITKEHDVITMKYNIWKDTHASEIFAKRIPELEKYEYKNGDYCIISPKSMKDIIVEGQQMSHCVGSYADSVAEGRTNIVFMRRVKTPEDSLITIQINNEGKVVQKKGYANRTPIEPDQYAFIKKWKKAKGLE